MTLKSVARPGAIAATAVFAAVALTACSAGQVSQTAKQVAAVDGAEGGGHAGTGNAKLLVRDVTVVVAKDDPEAVLKFTAINNDSDLTTYNLKSVKVDGETVTLGKTGELQKNCMVVSDTADQIELMTKAPSSCIYYTTASMKNPGYPIGGNVPVIFDFGDGGEIDVVATVSEPLLAAGEVDRDYGADYGAHPAEGGHTEGSHKH